MTVVVSHVPAEELPAGLVAVGLGVLAGPEGPELAGPLPPVAGLEVPSALDPGWCARQGFTAKAGQVLALRRSGGPTTLLLGLGPTTGLDAERWRRAGAALVRAAGEGGAAALLLPSTPPLSTGGEPHGVVGSAVAEGAVLASYRYEGLRTTPRPASLDRLLVVGGQSGDGVAAGLERGSRIAWAVMAARDLINTPPSELPPARLAELAAADLEGRPGTTVEVWDERRLAAERMGGILGVGRGSSEPPRLVQAHYQPADPLEVDGRVPHVVLVGKGITFDSGGLSLKTADGMTTMKTDMSGAAIVLSVLGACGDLGVRVRVTALATLAENMPDGRAIKPGDVLTIRNGSTIEVLNTDAEGRLVLADGLSLATELDPDAIVDVATLTGAVTVALGTSIAGLFGNDQPLVDRVRDASRAAGEQLWPLPLPEEYNEHLDSEVADMKNIGRPGQAGAIVAALLLGRFVGSVPWVHLDIAGTGRSPENAGYLSKGGTAFGVRTLLELLSSYR